MDEASLEEETSSLNSSPPADFPKKNRHRQRAHCNPLSDSFIAYPANPSHVNWPKLYPTDPEAADYVKFNTVEHPEDYSSPIDSEGFPKVSILDVGCGYGGLLVHLSSLFPDKLSLGMEIREKYRNIAVVRTNSMKFLTNYIGRDQLYTWMENALDDHPLFEKLADPEKEQDECFQTFDSQTEEGIKNLKNNVTTYKNVYYRI